MRYQRQLGLQRNRANSLHGVNPESIAPARQRDKILLRHYSPRMRRTQTQPTFI